MQNNSFKIIIVILVIVVLAIVVVLAKNTDPQEVVTLTPELEAFNNCLADSGAKFYGAIWCPHCAEQKEILGYTKFQTPPTYIECSPVQGAPLLAECQAAGIQSFPTWDFADGSRQTGTMSIDMLSAKTSCELGDLTGSATSTDSAATSTISE